MEIFKTKAFRIVLLAIFVFVVSRLVNLTIIPIFADEAIYIHWAQRAWHNATERFISFSDGKPPLHTWVMIPFLKTINYPLIAGRVLSILAGLFTFFGTYLLVRKLFGKKPAFWVLPFALFSPFLLFYDRLAVADSMLTAFYVWATYLAYRLYEKTDLGNSFLLAIALVGGLLTKQTAYYSFLLVGLVYLTKQLAKKNRKIINKKKLFYFIFALFLGLACFNFIIRLAPNSHLLSARTYDYVLGKREWLSDPFQLFWGNLKGISGWVGSYQTISWLVLLLTLPWLVRKKAYKLVVIFAGFLLPILGSAFIGRIIFPRYFVIVQPYLNIVFGLAFYYLWQKVRGKKKYLLLLLFVQPVFFCILLIANPAQAPLIQREQDQYLTTWASGYGIKEVADYLKENYPEQEVQVFTEGYFGTLPDGILVYLDNYPHIAVNGIGHPVYELPEYVLQSVESKPTFLAVNSSRLSLPDEQRSRLELIKEYPKPEFDFWQESLLFYAIK
jgi:4-amino-4-deoxy-L-arabinose transferase-like glycosyltransferase